MNFKNLASFTLPGLIIGLVVGYFVFPLKPSTSLTRIDDPKTAQRWVDQNEETSKGVYMSNDVLKELETFNFGKYNRGNGTFLYYAVDDQGTPKLLMVRSANGSAASSYYEVTRKQNDIIICPPICDLNSPLVVENECDCREGKNTEND